MANSLLPQQILPPLTPWGDVDKLGVVSIRKNWWLFLYNVAQSAGLGQITALDLEALIQSFDSPMAPIEPPIVFPDVAPTFDLNDVLFPDPPMGGIQAQPESAITVGLSPFTYQAPANGWVIVNGGTVSDISMERTTTFYTTGLITGQFGLSRLDNLRVTYLGTPTMTFFPA